MSEQILTTLKRKLDDLASSGELDAETRRNALKEELQFYVLNFIYHHPEYNKWIMYGGSALRIIHGLDRMSVDLDFEVSHTVTEKFLEGLKKELEEHFENTYGAGSDFLTIKITTGRGLLLKFHVGETLSFGHPSNQVHVRIDLNHFVTPKTVVRENRVVNKGQLSFVIVTYNMSALMASKLAAIFLRESRGIDKSTYDYKGRDIYDLLWYMSRKIVPDFDYVNAKLKEKGKEAPNIKSLFDKLTIDILNYEKMDECLKADGLPYLFENPYQFDNWLKNWRESYLRLLDDYKIHTVTALKKVIIEEDFRTDDFFFFYVYDTVERDEIKIIYNTSYEWIRYEKLLSVEVRDDLLGLIKLKSIKELDEPLKRFFTLFFQKNVVYLKKVNNILLGDSISTKLIRTKADNFNPKEQIVLNKSTLLSCELDDLLK